MFPNDSDHDVDLACLADGDPSDCSGRLTMEVDNLCLPRMSTQRINARFQNTANAHGAANPVFMSTAAGWNMVGLPIVAGGYEYGDMFGIDLNGDGISDTPEPTSGTLYSFNGGYNEEAAMAPGQGYWLRFDMPCCDPAIYGVPGHPMGGYDLLTQTISLREGWNMISGISASADPSADVDDPGGVIVGGSLYGFSGTYQASSSIAPGKGYWINTYAGGDITISSGGAAKTRSVFTDRTEKANKLSFNGSDLYFGVSIPEEEMLSYQLPPKPPEGAFDVRFADNMKVAENSGAIEIMNNTDRLFISYTINIDAGEQLRWVLTSNEGKEYELNDSGEIVVGGGATGFTLNKISGIPFTYSVSQNYPNPFNPVTRLQFEVGDQVSVRLIIYDLLGSVVRTFEEKEYNPGKYTINWDGKDNLGNYISSGIYVYRITAGDFVDHKKMTLIR